MIAAEDTRNTIKLCNHFEIKTPLMSYHEHNLEAGGEKILALLAEGKTIALVSDAGMPCISDPGADIAVKALAAAYDVDPIPGANAAISALVASGLSPQPFLFFGFLSRNKKERRNQIDLLKTTRNGYFIRSTSPIKRNRSVRYMSKLEELERLCLQEN